jgi:hypothetical protein
MNDDQHGRIVPDKLFPMTSESRDALLQNMQSKIDGMRHVVEGFILQLNQMTEILVGMSSPADSTRDYIDQIIDKGAANSPNKEDTDGDE